MKKLSNSFINIIPTWNAKDYISDAISSVVNQEFEDKGLIIRDDLSDDGTYEEIVNLIGIDGVENQYTKIKNTDIIFVKNSKKHYPCGNIWTSIDDFVDNDEAIIGTVDGDDKLIDNNVLKEIYDIYKIGKYWLVWSQHVDSQGNKGLSKPLPPDQFLQTRNYWSVSHYRTAKAFLYKKIKREHLVDPFDESSFFKMCGDALLLFPLAEMAGNEKSHFYDRICYLYNNNTGNNEHSVDLQLQHKYSHFAKTYPKYKKL